MIYLVIIMVSYKQKYLEMKKMFEMQINDLQTKIMQLEFNKIGNKIDMASKFFESNKFLFTKENIVKIMEKMVNMSHGFSTSRMDNYLSGTLEEIKKSSDIDEIHELYHQIIIEPEQFDMEGSTTITELIKYQSELK